MIFDEIKSYKRQFIEAWNDEFGEYYPMYDELINQAAIHSKHIVKEATKVIVEENKLIGIIVTKIYKGEVPIESYLNTGFISLIYVKREERNKGYGKLLIDFSLNELIKLGVKKVHLGMDINNFFPGIPIFCANKASLSFLSNNGFIRSGRAFNLILSKNPHFTFEHSYVHRVASIDDKEPLLTFIKREFSARWYYEALEYFKIGGSGREFVLLLDHDIIIGFARINDQKSKQIMHNINWSKRYTNLGGIGPLGVDHKYRGRKLGSSITNYGTQVLFDRGCSDVLVDWTGIVQFYEKSGFIICDEFLAYQLEL